MKNMYSDQGHGELVESVTAEIDGTYTVVTRSGSHSRTYFGVRRAYSTGDVIEVRPLHRWSTMRVSNSPWDYAQSDD